MYKFDAESKAKLGKDECNLRDLYWFTALLCKKLGRKITEFSIVLIIIYCLILLLKVAFKCVFRKVRRLSTTNLLDNTNGSEWIMRRRFVLINQMINTDGIYHLKFKKDWFCDARIKSNFRIKIGSNFMVEISWILKSGKVSNGEKSTAKKST